MSKKLSGKVKRLRIYVGEEAYVGKKPFYQAVLEEARKHDIAGGTVFKGICGYGAYTRFIRTNRFLELSSDLPIVIEFIEDGENLLKLKSFFEKNLEKGLVTLEEVEVMGYSAGFSDDCEVKEEN